MVLLIKKSIDIHIHWGIYIHFFCKTTTSCRVEDMYVCEWLQFLLFDPYPESRKIVLTTKAHKNLFYKAHVTYSLLMYYPKIHHHFCTPQQHSMFQRCPVLRQRRMLHLHCRLVTAQVSAIVPEHHGAKWGRHNTENVSTLFLSFISSGTLKACFWNFSTATSTNTFPYAFNPPGCPGVS